MKPWSWLLLVALAVSPAIADDKKKDEKKAKEAAAAQVPAAPDALKEAEARLSAGDSDGAVDILGKAMAADPKAALRLGQLREARGELDLAVDAYKSAADRLSGPLKGEALGRLAAVQETRGMADAGANAEAAIAADPEGLWPTIAMSHRRAHQGKLDEAIGLAQKAVAAGGGAAATSALAHAQEAKGDLAAAEASYRQAAAADPAALMPIVGLATVLRETGRAAEAEPMLKKVIDLSPGAVEAYKELARVKIALGRVQEAFADVNLAAAMSENDPEAQELVTEAKVARALQDLAGGQTDLAVQDLTQLREQNPNSAAVRLGLGRAQVARRDADAALAELQKAVEIDPRNAEAQYQLGYVYHVMKQNPASAIPAFEKATAAEPGNTLFRTSLGSALTDAGQLDRAVEELGRVTGSEGYTGWQAWFSLGTAHLKANRYKDAAGALETAVARKADNAQAEAFLAWSYFGLKDAENFKAHGAKARRLGYKDAQLFERLTRVEAGEAIK
jgi:tetratricopeptide (TPR) repeat protein